MVEIRPLEVQPAPRRTPWLGYGVVLVAAGMVAVLFQPVTPEEVSYENVVSDLGLADRLSELNQVPGGWIGVLEVTWEGAKDKQQAMELCQNLVAQFNPEPTESILLMAPGGLPAAECYRPRDSTPAPNPSRPTDDGDQ